MLIGRRALNRIIMVPYIPIRKKYTNISRLSFSFGYKCVARTSLSSASRRSRSHAVFPLRACLHEGGVLQVGEVTCLAVLEK